MFGCHPKSRTDVESSRSLMGHSFFQLRKLPVCWFGPLPHRGYMQRATRKSRRKERMLQRYQTCFSTSCSGQGWETGRRDLPCRGRTIFTLQLGCGGGGDENKTTNEKNETKKEADTLSACPHPTFLSTE